MLSQHHLVVVLIGVAFFWYLVMAVVVVVGLHSLVVVLECRFLVVVLPGACVLDLCARFSCSPQTHLAWSGCWESQTAVPPGVYSVHLGHQMGTEQYYVARLSPCHGNVPRFLKLAASCILLSVLFFYSNL